MISNDEAGSRDLGVMRLCDPTFYSHFVRKSSGITYLVGLVIQHCQIMLVSTLKFT